MQVKSTAECSKGSILQLSTFIKLPIVIKIFVYFWVAILHRFNCMDSRYYFPMKIHNTIAAVPMSTEPMLSDSFRELLILIAL